MFSMVRHKATSLSGTTASQVMEALEVWWAITRTRITIPNARELTFHKRDR